MAYFASLWKARIIEKHRREYENEKINSIFQSNTKVPKDSGLKWRLYGYDTKRRMSGQFKKMFPDGSKISNLLLYLKTDQTFPNFLLKSLIGFLGGILLTYLGFMFFVFQLSISLVHATIMSSIIGVLLTLGLAFSYRIRCLVFLLIPQFFSRIGRYTLTCYALILILTGPATNTLRNSEVLTESMACSQEQIKANVRHLTDSAKSPYNAIKDSIRVMLAQINRVNDKMDDIVRKIEGLVINIADIIQSSYAWLNKTVNTCNRKLGSPYQHCMHALAKGIPNCISTLGPKFSWLCNVTTVESACEIVRSYREMCLLDEFAKGSFAATIKRKLREFTTRIKRMFYASIQIHHRFTISTNASQSASQIANGIITEIRNRADPLLTWLSWSSCATSLFLLLIIFRAKYYQHMYETRSRFDNCYVTKELYELDWKRFQEGRDTILPLNRREKAKYIPTTSFRLVTTEKVFLSRSAVVMAITTFKLMIHMVADYSLYWVLMTIRYHGRFQSLIPPGPPDAGIKVTGTGFGADLLRSIFNILTVPLYLPASSPISCLPNPHPPDFQRYYQIGVLIILLWLFALFEPYGLRLRHVIMGHYRPERAKARATWLYNHILRTRGSFMKLARRKLHREYKYSGEENLTFRHWVDSHIPCYFLRRLLGTLPKEPHCLLCDTIDLLRDPDTRLIRCETPSCPGIYCRCCFTDIGELCTICMSPADYGDLSDISLEKGSTDDDSDNDINECKADSSKDYLKLSLLKSKINYRKEKCDSYYSKSNRDEYSEKISLLESFDDNLELNEYAGSEVQNSDFKNNYDVYGAKTHHVRNMKNKTKHGRNYVKFKCIRFIIRYFKKTTRYKLKLPRIKSKAMKRKRIHEWRKIKMSQFNKIISKYLSRSGNVRRCICPKNICRKEYFCCFHIVMSKKSKPNMDFKALLNRKRRARKNIIVNRCEINNHLKLNCTSKMMNPSKLAVNSADEPIFCTRTDNELNATEENGTNDNIHNEKPDKKQNENKGKMKNTPTEGMPKTESKKRNCAKTAFIAFSTCLCLKNKLTSSERKLNDMKNHDRSFQKQKNNFKRRKKKEKIVTKSDETIKIKADTENTRNYRITAYLQDQCWNKGSCRNKESLELLTKECALDDLANLRMAAARNKAREAEILKILAKKDSLNNIKAKKCNCPETPCICVPNQGTCHNKCHKPVKKERSFFKCNKDNIFHQKCKPKDVCCKYVRHAIDIDQAVSATFPEVQSNEIKVHDFEAGKHCNKTTEPHRRHGVYCPTRKEFGKIGDGYKLYNFINETKICEDQYVPVNYEVSSGQTNKTKKPLDKIPALKAMKIKDIKLVLSERCMHIRIKNPAPMIKNLYKGLTKSRKHPNGVQYTKDTIFNRAFGGKSVFPIVQSSSCQYVDETIVQDRGTQMRQKSDAISPKVYCDAAVEVVRQTCTCATQCRNINCVEKGCSTDAKMKISEHAADKRPHNVTNEQEMSSDYSTSNFESSSTSNAFTHSDDTKTDTTICSRVAVDLIEETPVRAKINKHVKKIKVNVTTKTNQGTTTDFAKFRDVSTITDDWWSPIVERKTIKRIKYEPVNKCKLMHDKCISTDRHRIVKFLSRAQIIPRDILSPSRYLLESQKYYNELFTSKLFAPHLFPVLVATKEKDKAHLKSRYNHLRKNRKTKRLEDYSSPRSKGSNIFTDKICNEKSIKKCQKCLTRENCRRLDEKS
ncbi:uncharacterized protein LOC123702833 isoform X2 [Colias croceus]|uniref:uncharacterized protein LOC123702833 isoform X2 n=1 Tax=Colias crocea TaxID=72248 RepID=UPI001E27BD41|nr:uncharacterized protein LOC123702833 isoform X2 [Colias croceus]